MQRRVPALTAARAGIWSRATWSWIGPRQAILQPIDRTRIAYAAQAVPPERYETTVLANYGGEFGRDQHVFAQWLAQSFNAGDLVDGWSDQNTVTLARSAAGAA